jgi:hypothetical protein
VIHHVRLCFLACWMSARPGKEWRDKGESEAVPRRLRKLQSIRVGTLQLGDNVCERLMTEVPKDLNSQLTTLGLAGLFAAPPEESRVEPDKNGETPVHTAFRLRGEDVR